MFVDEDTEAATLYAASEKEIRANARLIGAKATQKLLLGVGGAALLMGGGVGLACLGYSRVVDKQVVAQQEANDVFFARLARTPLKTEGTVKVADGGEVALKGGGLATNSPRKGPRSGAALPCSKRGKAS
jgi:hypothetical protein